MATTIARTNDSTIGSPASASKVNIITIDRQCQRAYTPEPVENKYNSLHSAYTITRFLANDHDPMAKVCSRCLRGPRTGNVRSHSNIATKRRTMLNLQHRIVKGSRMLICTSCIKTLQKEKTPV